MRQQWLVAERFWAKVDKTPGQGPNGDCWVWKGARRNNTLHRFSTTYYGGFRFRGRCWEAHRVSYLLTYGDLQGKWVLHKCDNPGCVRPEHLYLGDAFNNAQDRWQRGRGNDSLGKSRHQRARGEAHGQTKLTEKQVLEIRELWSRSKLPATHIAARYGVSDVTIRNIGIGKTWGHVSKQSARSHEDGNGNADVSDGGAVGAGVVDHGGSAAGAGA